MTMPFPLPPLKLDLKTSTTAGDLYDLKNLASNFARRGHVFNYRSAGATGGEGVSGSAGGSTGSATGQSQGMGQGNEMQYVIYAVAAIVIVKLMKG